VPELPEVETVVRELRPHLTGRKIVHMTTSGKSLRRPWASEWESNLAGQVIERVWRRGKWIILDMAKGGRFVFHLGMTGQLTVKPTDAPVETHTHLLATLSGKNKQLRLRDVRRFGSAEFFADQPALEEFFESSKLGPEPFELPPRYWRERLAATDRCLKAVLLDQRVVVGVGNIYADESLHRARLHPARQARDLSAEEVSRLRRAIVAVLRQAIERRGSSIRDYIGGSGRKGRFQREFRVYGRPGKPCLTCRAPIERIRLAGRSTHFCPRCQPAPE
jgi:formamidopyrimidine-DNA glycosylase